MPNRHQTSATIMLISSQESPNLMWKCHYHIEAKTKWPAFCKRHFPVHFLEWKFVYFDLNFTEVSSQWCNYQQASIGFDNGLGLNMHQAIFGSNDGLVYWCIYASLGLNKLKDWVWIRPVLPASVWLWHSSGIFTGITSAESKINQPIGHLRTNSKAIPLIW